MSDPTTNEATRWLPLLLQALSGEPRAEEVHQRIWACYQDPAGEDDEASRSPWAFQLPEAEVGEGGRLMLPGLAAPLPPPWAAYAAHVLFTWTVLVGPQAQDPRAVAAASCVLRAVWKPTPKGEVLGTPGRVWSLPLVWLAPPGCLARPLREGEPLTWGDSREEASRWFRAHLEHARGRDEIAAWVLRRMPPVWLLPERTSAATPGMPGAGPAWAMASDDELRGVPRRRPRISGGRSP